MSASPKPKKGRAPAGPPKALLPKGGTPQTKSLVKVLEQTEHVQQLVAQSAEELSSANTVIRQELADQGALPGAAHALEKSEAVESKVHEASDKLTGVNRALEGEVRERVLLDHQFAAAKEQEQAARHAALHDALTGLPNRALLNDRLEHGLAQARRHGGVMAVMFMDLDKFKTINDTHGHDAGDSILKTMAQRLSEHTRGDDTVGRLGGDEFLLLFMDTRGDSTLVMIAENILTAMRTPCEVVVGGLGIHLNVGASIGIALFPKDGTDAETLIKRADEAMYQAKQKNSGYAFAG